MIEFSGQILLPWNAMQERALTHGKGHLIGRFTLTGSRKPFPPTSGYLMTLRAAHSTRLRLFFNCALMPDEQSCNLRPAEDDCTPKVYERTYHSCKNTATRCSHSILCSLVPPLLRSPFILTILPFSASLG